ncbi:MAG: hypothetical protein ACE5DI_02550 [Candidatus Micrarchaeia archaeon]
MSVIGDDIVLNCRKCYSENGFGIRLEKQGDRYVCGHDSSHRYVLKNGYMENV